METSASLFLSSRKPSKPSSLIHLDSLFLMRFQQLDDLYDLDMQLALKGWMNQV